jgi:hypothetical protein
VQVPVAAVQIHVPPGPVSEETVVFAGSVSVTVTLVAVLGPEFVSTCVYVTLAAAATGTGDAAFVMLRLAEPATPTVAVALLLPGFGSIGVVSATDTASLIVPVTVAPTVTTKVKTADAPEANVVFALFLQSSVPKLQVQPVGPASDEAVVPVGSVSVTVIVPAVADPAVAGPRFFTVCV